MALRKHIAALTLAALPAVATVPAVAGSLAEPAPAPVVEPVVIEIAPLWAGGYVGAQLGYNWSDSGTSYDGEGIIGGVNAGWLGQSDAFVYGAEAEWDWGDEDLTGLGLLKAKFGYATGPALIYAVAGGAYGEADIIPTGATTSKGYTDWGWMVGAGVSYMVTDAVFVGGEVDYMQWDEFDNSGVDVDATALTVRVGYSF